MIYRGSELSDEEVELYSRQIVLPEIGIAGQERLKRARVVIIGMGGLGCPTAVTLAAMGVGYIRLVDRDVVEKSNLHRQYLYSYKDVGYSKVEVAAKKLIELNPYIEVDPLPIFVDEKTAIDVVSDVDLVIDGLDNITARRAVNRACLKTGTPYLFSAAIQTYGVMSLIIPGKTACLECIFADVSDDALPKCSVVGVHPAILKLISAIQVFEATNYLIYSSSMLQGRLLYCDLKNLSIDLISISRVEKCPACSSGIKVEEVRREYPFIEEVCGREGVATFIITPGGNMKIPVSILPSLAKELDAIPIILGELGATFRLKNGCKISLLQSGVAVIEGAKSKEDAAEIYGRLISLIKKGVETELGCGG